MMDTRQGIDDGGSQDGPAQGKDTRLEGDSPGKDAGGRLFTLLAPPFRNQLSYDTPWHEYQLCRGINPSKLVDAIKSPKHFLVSGQGNDKPDRALLVGSMTHTLVFEQEYFDDRYAVYPGKIRAGKEWGEFVADNFGKDYPRLPEYQQADAIADAVLAHNRALDLINQTKHEVSVFCEDREMQCKGRIDGITDGMLLDLKTTTDASPEAFGRQFARLRYGAKLSCYKRWAEKNGKTIDEVMVIAAETKPPYDVVVYRVPEPVLDSGWARMDKALHAIRDAITRKDWPGIAESDIVDLVVPNWDMEVEELLVWDD